ncbi:unnamed protein product, partial [Prorocentrum cordatum]
MEPGAGRPGAAPSGASPVRARLDALLERAAAQGLCDGGPGSAGDGTIVGDAAAVAKAAGIRFTTVYEVLAEAEEALQLPGCPAVVALRVGDLCEVVSPVCVRREEALDSEVLVERVAPGRRLRVLEVGRRDRPRIRVAGAGGGATSGWVSVRAHGGDELVRPVEAPRLAGAAGSIGPVEQLSAGLAALGSSTSAFVSQVLGALAEQSSRIAEQSQLAQRARKEDAAEARRQLE